MKRHTAKTILLIFCISFLHLLPVPYGPVPDVRAQESGLKVGGYQWGGDIELGYRFTDIDGRNRYKETVNLMEGVRLFDLNLWGNDPEKKGLVDSFRINLNSIGNPFPFGRVEIKKSKAYDLTATYREYKYFFARTENGFLTDNFSFNQTTRRGTLARLFSRRTISSSTLATTASRGMGMPVFPEAFIQPQVQDLDEVFNEYFAGADFSIGKVDLHVKQSYWTFENKDSIAGPVQSERRDEEVDTYVSTIKGHTHLGERWDLNAGYIYAHSSGRAHLETTPVLVNPGSNTFNVNTHIVETGLSHLLRQGLLLHLDYRFDAKLQDGRVTNDPAIRLTSYNAYSNTGTAQLEYIPKPNLTLRGGYRVQYRDIDFDNGEPNTGVSQGGKHPYDTDILTHGMDRFCGLEALQSLERVWRVRGGTVRQPVYTDFPGKREYCCKGQNQIRHARQEPERNRDRLVERRVNPDQHYRVDVRDVGLAAAYQPSFLPKLSADASITYEMIQNRKDITNEDFAPALNQHFVFNSNATILSGGLTDERGNPYKGLGARLYGSYAKTTKEDPQIYGDGLIKYLLQE